MDDADDRPLRELTAHLVADLAGDLQAVVLFGSAAEGRRRNVSDTNLVLVLGALAPARIAAARERLALARVALRLRLMVLRADELPAAAAAFAVKFADILRRRRVLHGPDPFAGLAIPRPAAIAQLRQALLNAVLRLREQWLSAAGDPQLALAAAEAAGGLRACAAELLALEGSPAPTPREALERIAGGAIAGLGEAREGRLPAGAGAGLVEHLLALADAMRTRAETLG